MNQDKKYVRDDGSGGLRVGELDVSLDSVVIGYKQGYSAETIQQLYPVLTLEEVYGAIAFYLANQEEVETYLKHQDERWQEGRQATAGKPSAVVTRLRTMSPASRSATP